MISTIFRFPDFECLGFMMRLFSWGRIAEGTSSPRDASSLAQVSPMAWTSDEAG